jgi:hypothetical protein
MQHDIHDDERDALIRAEFWYLRSSERIESDSPEKDPPITSLDSQ